MARRLAQEQGLVRGLRVLKVNGQPATGMTKAEVVDLVRENPSAVQLRVKYDPLG